MDRLGRYLPFTGLIFVVLTVIAILPSSNSPGASASGARVIAWYKMHASDQKLSDFMFAFAFLFLIFFVGTIYNYIQRSPAARPWGIVSLASVVLFAVGFLLFASIDYTLASVPTHLTPSAAQALGALENDLVFPAAIGSIATGITLGLAIIRSGLLPAWLGWAAIVWGVILFTPAFIAGLLILLIWSICISILIYRRSAEVAVEAPGMAATPLPAV